MRDRVLRLDKGVEPLANETREGVFSLPDGLPPNQTGLYPREHGPAPLPCPAWGGPRSWPGVVTIPRAKQPGGPWTPPRSQACGRPAWIALGAAQVDGVNQHGRRPTPAAEPGELDALLEGPSWFLLLAVVGDNYLGTREAH